MGKKNRNVAGDGQPNYAKSVDRAFRRLGLPDGRTFLGWRTFAVQRFGESAAEEFVAIFERSKTISTEPTN